MNITRFESWNLFDIIQRDFDCLTDHQLSYAGHDGNSEPRAREGRGGGVEHSEIHVGGGEQTDVTPGGGW